MKKLLKERLRELRAAKEVGQKEVAKAIGVSWRTISHYETGYSQPDLDIFIRLCVYFETTADYLLGLKDYET